MTSWYALQTKPQSERFVHDVAASRGLEPYLPIWDPSPRRNKPSVLRPYFPTYLFVRCDLAAVGLSSLQYMPGVRRLIFAGDQPASIQDQVIAELRMRLKELERELAGARANMPRPGERVVITSGVFAGYEALFDRELASGERARVLVDFLQKRIPVELNSAFIERKRFGTASMDLRG